MPALLLLNGPNLNLLGSREPHHYGNTTLAELEMRVRDRAAAAGFDLLAAQSNHEGVLIDAIQAAPTNGVSGIIINPGGYTHHGVAIRDALIAAGLPFIEVHLSNTYARESFRHTSVTADIAAGVIIGLGALGYELAVEALAGSIVR
jgi:3-dehydroquinate dehydratase-2